MKPETTEFLAYARKLLDDAVRMLNSGLPEHAARTAYLACFHTARAYAFERLGHVARTHKGVQSEFYRLSKDHVSIDPDLRAFLARAYAYKASADYETGPEHNTTSEDASAAVEAAKRFVTEFACLTPLSGATA